MNPLRLLFILFRKHLSNGLWFKLRLAYPAKMKMVGAFFNFFNSSKKISDNSTPKEATILIVGLGTSALACAKELFKDGYSNISFISKDFFYGGKCVNVGCMPIEFSLYNDESIKDKNRNNKALQAFIESLQNDVKSQFDSLNFPIINDQVNSIDGNQLLLGSGQALKFDRLILALGNHFPNPERIPLSSSKVISIEEVWNLPISSKLVIYSKNNPSAISLAEAMCSAGLEVTLILSGKNPFENLPSWNYLIRIASKRGIRILDRDVRLIRVDQTGVSYEVGSKIETISYDYFVTTSKPETPNLPIDGVATNLSDIDLRVSSLLSRKDIFILGDAAGFLSASEAEEHGRMTAKWISNGEKIDLDGLSKIPIGFHGLSPLAMVGEPWTLTTSENRWKEVDFRQLGWTKVHKHEGKLWYYSSDSSQKIDAIHICHPLANELISTARMLLEKEKSDSCWKICSVHPSASEIFKLIV